MKKDYLKILIIQDNGNSGTACMGQALVDYVMKRFNKYGDIYNNSDFFPYSNIKSMSTCYLMASDILESAFDSCNINSHSVYILDNTLNEIDNLGALEDSPYEYQILDYSVFKNFDAKKAVIYTLSFDTSDLPDFPEASCNCDIKVSMFGFAPVGHHVDSTDILTLIDTVLSEIELYDEVEFDYLCNNEHEHSIESIYTKKFMGRFEYYF